MSSAALLNTNIERAIKNDADVLSQSGTELVYRVKEVRGNIQLYKFAIGPLEAGHSCSSPQFDVLIQVLQIVITYDSVTTGIVLEAFVNLPFLPTISLGKVSGSLKEGIVLKIGYKAILSGELSVKLKDGHAFLGYGFTVLGKTFGGEVKIF
ncbi:hypothetical protein D9756_010978 [Leucocoprinus leucothites]|uniref:Uncharacterized protein n=1 Tax=Leucocoprinus leucothites TaxID=201217 RepID=A0A8H5CP57_9AGAR|nr:hypothetical protein D9756_010978 [Leucoagaricus leucothites]